MKKIFKNFYSWTEINIFGKMLFILALFIILSSVLAFANKDLQLIINSINFFLAIIVLPVLLIFSGKRE